MLVSVLGLLVSAAPVLLYIEESSTPGPEVALAARAALSQAVEQTQGTAPLLSEHDPSCGDAEPCAARLAGERGLEQVLLVRVLAGLTRTRVVTSVLLDGVRQPPRTIDLSGPPSAWSIPLQAVVAEAFPPPSPEVGSRRWIPMTIAGAGAGALAIGGVLGILSRTARSELASSSGRSTLALADRADGQALAANVLFGAGTACLFGGLAWLALGSAP